jgi:hypothetical protein
VVEVPAQGLCADSSVKLRVESRFWVACAVGKAGVEVGSIARGPVPCWRPRRSGSPCRTNPRRSARARSWSGEPLWDVTQRRGGARGVQSGGACRQGGVPRGMTGQGLTARGAPSGGLRRRGLGHRDEHNGQEEGAHQVAHVACVVACVVAFSCLSTGTKHTSAEVSRLSLILKATKAPLLRGPRPDRLFRGGAPRGSRGACQTVLPSRKTLMT